MDRSPDSSDWPARYAVVEKAYCDSLWGAVMDKGTQFLRDLPEGEGDGDLKALRHRAQLLMAHSLLHGFGDRGAADGLYALVDQDDVEPSLRQIAAEGREQCREPLAAAAPADEDERREEPSASQALPAAEPAAALQPLARLTDGVVAADPFRPSGAPPNPQSESDSLPVMPWQTPAASSAQPLPTLALVPEVVEEPELIEVHQASPELAEQLDLAVDERVETPFEGATGDIAPEAERPSRAPSARGDEALRAGLLTVVVPG
jgi:hypothetical protein